MVHLMHENASTGVWVWLMYTDATYILEVTVHASL